MTAAYATGYRHGADKLPFAPRAYRRNGERLDYGEGFTDALLERPIRTGRF